MSTLYSRYIVLGARLFRGKELSIMTFAFALASLCFVLKWEYQGWGTYTYLTLMVLWLTNVFLLSGAFVSNDYHDIKFDYINKPEKVIIGNELSRRKAILTQWGLTLVGLLLSMAISWKALIFFMFFSIVLWSYTVYFKRTFIWGNIVAGLLGAGFMLQFSLVFDLKAMPLYIYSMFAFIFVMLKDLIKDLVNYYGEKAGGVDSMPVRLGIRRSKQVIMYVLVFFVLLWSIFLIYYFQGFYLAIAFILMLPILLFVKVLRNADTRTKFRRVAFWFDLLTVYGMVSMFFLKI
ncbi:UbiA family prenyltransferase [Aureibacter tunicatorum]|uniref:4-hydroxybenzoate polyprenyltransferase n=1 Tax=Aureibacter tunicatorum TaxID=866807 RepID=A0AAE4BSG9_9BACT|nr:UbiA family prenyltransferase [Aureibacter tunicatorum]MDR6238392.1 4-hydroxybenzoate polyprenyltransferase [Aureibacter tunicatorum]BDD03424.1 hypothetical protein AUTU_09070 [Aureibacter tunicatorum]